ncbi:MAG: hypothetical protein IT514_06095 [Burkholderiales bacterium]|nr:hypothetical protein [Burkholderiales bacterium]
MNRPVLQLLLVRVAVLLLACLAAARAAEPGSDFEVRRLQDSLAQLQQEQQAIYQDFQMTQGLRALEMQDASAAALQDPGYRGFNSPPPNYDDVVRSRREREERLHQYSDDLKRLYTRYREIEEEKAALRGRIRDLMQPRRE